MLIRSIRIGSLKCLQKKTKNTSSLVSNWYPGIKHPYRQIRRGSWTSDSVMIVATENWFKYHHTPKKSTCSSPPPPPTRKKKKIGGCGVGDKCFKLTFFSLYFIFLTAYHLRPNILDPWYDRWVCMADIGWLLAGPLHNMIQDIVCSLPLTC